MKASDMMKITSSMITNRKKQTISSELLDESLEIYKNHFKSMNTNSLPALPTTTEPIILNLPSLPLIDELRPHISTSSIGLILKNISWNKSLGASGLTYDILKIALCKSLMQSRVLWIYCHTEVYPIKLEALANCPRAEEGWFESHQEL